MTHDQVIALIQAHKEGKTIEKNWSSEFLLNDQALTMAASPRRWVEVRDLSELLTLAGDSRFILRIKPVPRYRAWREEEVPLCAEYRKKENIRYHLGDGFSEVLKAKTIANCNLLQHFFENYEYRTNLLEDKWHVCGVEVSDE